MDSIFPHHSKTIALLAVIGTVCIGFIFLVYNIMAARLRDMAIHLKQNATNMQKKLDDLSQDRARLLSIFNNMVEAVVAVDLNGHILAVNPMFARLFVNENESVKGKPFLEVLRHNGLNQILRHVLERSENKLDEVTTWNQGENVFEAHGVPLIQNNQCVGALLVLHDISKIKKLENIRKDFVANVSHELKTPLASIKGYAETLLSGALDDKKNRLAFVESIEKQANRMNALVDDLLDLTAIESGKRPPKKESVSLADLAREATESLKAMAAKFGVAIQIMDESLPVVTGDKNQIKQVFINLLDNALKFNSPNGTIRLFGEQDGENIWVVIEDTGVGIPPEDLPRIFERFYRVDKARSRERGGTGLGLSIVKHIIESHGGTISVESAIAKGSTFRFTLPR